MKTSFIKETYLNYFSIAIILCLIFNFYYQFSIYTVNIPVNDDYQAILEFLNNFKATNSFTERMNLIFSQHNEHRIVYDRIWTIISYKVFGEVNFNFLSFIGNLSYLFIFLIFSIPFKKIGYFYLIPVTVLIFNFSFHENMTFAMATLSNNTGIVFILLSLYFVLLESKWKHFFIFFYLLAVFTQGSGLFLTPILFGILLYKKEKLMLIIFSIVVLLTVLFYFIDYQKPPQNHSIIDAIKYFKFKSFLFFFSFIGSIFSFYLIFSNDLNDSLIFSSIIGGFLFIFYLILVKRKVYKTNLFLFSVTTIVIITGLVTSVTRVQFGLDTAIASRYRLFSAILVICCYYFILKMIKNKTILKNCVILFLSGVYFLNVSFKQIEYLDYRKNANYLGAINYNSNNHKLLNGFEQDFYKKTLEKSMYNQVYRLPSDKEIESIYPFSNQIPNFNYVNNTDLWFTQDVEQIYELKDSFLIFGKGFLDGKSTYDQKIYLEIQNDVSKQSITFETIQIKRYDMNPYFKKNNLEFGGYCCRIKKEIMDNQEYTINLSIINEGLYKKEISNKKLKKTF